MKMLVFLFTILSSLATFANSDEIYLNLITSETTLQNGDVVITGVIPSGHRLKKVDYIMMAQIESDGECNAMKLSWNPFEMLAGTTERTLHTKLRILDDGSFEAVVPGEKVEKLLNDYCRFEEYMKKIEFINPEGKTVTTFHH